MQVAPAAQMIVQPPPEQVFVQVELARHSYTHLEPEQVLLQVEPARQVVLQAPAGQVPSQVPERHSHEAFSLFGKQATALDPLSLPPEELLEVEPDELAPEEEPELPPDEPSVVVTVQATRAAKPKAVRMRQPMFMGRAPWKGPR